MSKDSKDDKRLHYSSSSSSSSSSGISNPPQRTRLNIRAVRSSSDSSSTQQSPRISLHQPQPGQQGSTGTSQPPLPSNRSLIPRLETTVASSTMDAAILPRQFPPTMPTPAHQHAPQGESSRSANPRGRPGRGYHPNVNGRGHMPIRRDINGHRAMNFPLRPTGSQRRLQLRPISTPPDTPFFTSRRDDAAPTRTTPTAATASTSTSTPAGATAAAGNTTSSNNSRLPRRPSSRELINQFFRDGVDGVRNLAHRRSRRRMQDTINQSQGSSSGGGGGGGGGGEATTEPRRPPDRLLMPTMTPSPSRSRSRPPATTSSVAGTSSTAAGSSSTAAGSSSTAPGSSSTAPTAASNEGGDEESRGRNRNRNRHRLTEFVSRFSTANKRRGGN